MNLIGVSIYLQTKERANTVIESIIDNQKMNLNYYRDIVQPDIIHLKLNKPLKAK